MSIAAAMSSLTLQSKLGPTVRPDPSYDAEKSAGALRKAMKGMGTDEKAIIKVLTTQSAAQRLETAKMFKTLFGKDLIDDLKSECSGSFEDAIIQTINGASGLDATQLRKAMRGAGTDEKALIEIMTTRSNKEVEAILEYYKTEIHRDLEKDMSSETSGHFRRILVSLCQANRDENPEVDQAKAEADAQKLYSAGEGKIGTDESGFNQVLARRSFPQLNATFEAYIKVSGNDITKAIKHEFSGDIEDGLLGVVQCARNVHTFFAERLYKSMKGLGTDEDTLTRIIVSRSEIDLADIKAKYLELYKKTLVKAVKGETSGDYERMLVALLGDD